MHTCLRCHVLQAPNDSHVWQVAPGLPELLLWRSATISGFFLLQYATLYRQHLKKLVGAWQAGKLHVALDSHSFRWACPCWSTSTWQLLVSWVIPL